MGCAAAEICGEAMAGKGGGADMPETGRDPVPPMVGIGGGGGQLGTLGRQGTNVCTLQWEDVVEGLASADNEEG